jgi:WASH complex subunit CCDC53
MDENGLPIMGAGVDYLSVEAINQRKLINYLNSFFVSTASFMTSFSSKCETRLTQLSTRLGKIETSLRLIEEKVKNLKRTCIKHLI